MKTLLLIPLLCCSCSHVQVIPVTPMGDVGGFVSFTTSTQTSDVKPLKMGGKRTWPEIIKDQFWDWENPKETGKSIASIAIAAGATTYAAGWWDEDDIFGGSDHRSDQTARAQAEALRASSERNKNTVRVSGSPGSTIEVRDLPQTDNITLEVQNSSNASVVLDLQRDSGSR